MKEAVKKIFKTFGLDIRRAGVPIARNIYDPFTQTKSALNRCKERGFTPTTIIDVGAAEGKWSLAAMHIWQDCNYLLMEPLQERKAELTMLEKDYPNIHFVNAGAGDKKGRINFFVTDDLDGSGIADNGSNAKKRTIEINTIDDEVSRLNLQGPYAIKLDTHGYEVPILTGAAETLRNTELIIIECYGFQIAPDSLLFWEMCRLMQEKGFRLVDITDIMRREKDQAFWQCDAYFVPSNAQTFIANTYY